MEKELPIAIIRESSGHADIGTIEDGAVIEMKNIGGRLLIIKERSIYEMVYADTIDPERKNLNIPPTIQKLIIDKGSESEIVARTFLTAKTLFKPEYINETINCDSILSLAIDMLSDISQLEKEIKEYQEMEDKVSNEYEKRKTEKKAFQIPSIVNLESRCNTIFQKANHVEQILMDIITHFYTNHGLTKQSHFPKFHEVLKSVYGENDSFYKFISKTIYFMRVVRELRNGLDHRLSTYKLIDFELQQDGTILSPTIELNHKDVKLTKTSLSEFFKITTSNLIEIIEITFAFLAGKSVIIGRMPYQLREIPEDKRLHKFVRYSFWMPFGVEGFYCQ